MPNYRRAYANGATYFFTVNLNDRRARLLTDNINSLTGAFRHVKRKYPFKTDALVVLPEHLHAVLTLPIDDFDFSIRWRFIKGLFSKAVNRKLELPYQNTVRRELGIWQKRFWEHQVHDQQDYINHVNYCYYNPVKHGLVQRVADWRYSTFHRDVKKGIFPKDWGGNFNFSGNFGE